MNDIKIKITCIKLYKEGSKYQCLVNSKSYKIIQKREYMSIPCKICQIQYKSSFSLIYRRGSHQWRLIVHYQGYNGDDDDWEGKGLKRMA